MHGFPQMFYISKIVKTTTAEMCVCMDTHTLTSNLQNEPEPINSNEILKISTIAFQ